MQRLVTFEHLVELGYVNNRVTLARRIRRGEFPAPIRVGVRNVAWIKAELDAWEEARRAERSAARNLAKPANAAPGPGSCAGFDIGRAGAGGASAGADAATPTQPRAQPRTHRRTQI